jgi:hypothetical protein
VTIVSGKAGSTLTGKLLGKKRTFAAILASEGKESQALLDGR